MRSWFSFCSDKLQLYILWICPGRQTTPWLSIHKLLNPVEMFGT
jgi:hypothetical protein